MTEVREMTFHPLSFVKSVFVHAIKSALHDTQWSWQGSCNVAMLLFTRIFEKGKDMTIQVVGAGLYRTGTKSLKAALEVLLGRPSYHMAEVFIHPEHVATWHNAALGNMPNWHEFLKNYDATLDAPAAYFWPEISSAFPNALVLLSVRSEESWWQSASQTVMKTEG